MTLVVPHVGWLESRSRMQIGRYFKLFLRTLANKTTDRRTEHCVAARRCSTAQLRPARPPDNAKLQIGTVQASSIARAGIFFRRETKLSAGNLIRLFVEYFPLTKA
ncbi:MAG: hypothetical protein A3K04_09960 [Gallionellales bacterium RBG_16_56_9]|nr:MAG: hypothetical protein A3K04_09960 [Gallionellales bacterium RBG_16_56_9]